MYCVGRGFCDCERDFSGAGYVIQEQRSQLKPSKVDDGLFLHSNLKHPPNTRECNVGRLYQFIAGLDGCGMQYADTGGCGFAK